jgi:hypothetical protein
MTLIRDIAITDVTPSPDWAYAGWPIHIPVTAKNLGYITETFNVSAYYDDNLIATIEVLNLPAGGQKTINFTWETSGVNQGVYTISARTPTLPYETNTTNNIYTDGQVTIFTTIRDIAITNVLTPYNWSYQGWIVEITVTVKNLGQTTETFNVTTYYNETAINTITVTGLTPGQETNLTFAWNTNDALACHTYTIWSNATRVPYEYNITNNIFYDGTVKVRLMGDTNGDGIVDIKDVAAVSKAFGSTPSLPNWNPIADLNRDLRIDIKDVALVSKNFGSTC